MTTIAMNELRLPSMNLHLTVRGRRVLALLVLVAIGLGLGVAVTSAFSPVSSAVAVDPASAAAAGEVEFTYHSVQPGESLWTISESVAGDRDVRDVVQEIMRLNHLETATLQAGQRLALPLN